MTMSVPIGNEAARFYVTGPKELTDTQAVCAHCGTSLVSVAKYISPFRKGVFSLVLRAIFLAACMCIIPHARYEAG
jgi:hypothetical protein